MINSANRTIEQADSITLGEVSSWLSLHLAEEMCWVKDLDENEGSLLMGHLQPTPTKSFLVATKDCIAACFLLKSEGFSSIAAPYYSKGGLFAKMKDAWGNIYFIKEERSYQFDLPI